MGKQQTVNYFVHITHVPQLRQEHLVTVPEITVPQWRTRKVRQMEGQRRKSRAASHPLLGFFLSMIAMTDTMTSGIPLLVTEMCCCYTDVFPPIMIISNNFYLNNCQASKMKEDAFCRMCLIIPCENEHYVTIHNRSV